MNDKCILHVMILDKFIPPFIDFVKEHFGLKNQFFVILHKEKYEYGLTKEHPVIWIDKKIKVFKLISMMYKSDRIIIHGLWSERLIQLLVFQPWLLKKCYWIMWGGDFYFPENQSWMKKQVIKRMGYLVTGTAGDYQLAKQWYGAKGKHIKCFNYPSNLYKEYEIKEKKKETINILVGNSATETNNHIEMLEKLKKFKNENIKIFVPLSYGNEKYAKEVILYGQEIFGDKFIPITNFMPFQEYLEFLADIDIAIFNHKRQQAFGNIISLLGMGKKVYLNPESTLNGVMNEYGLKVFDTSDISLDLLDYNQRIKNINIVKTNFSKESLIISLSKYLR